MWLGDGAVDWASAVWDADWQPANATMHAIPTNIAINGVPNALPPAMASDGNVITPNRAAGPGAMSIFVETAFTDVSVCFWDEAE